MESLRNQGLIISQHLAKLRLDRLNSVGSADPSSTKQEQMAISIGAGVGSITRERLQEELAWELAELAQSCVYLAEELQVFAEKFLASPILCPVSTFRLQLDSAMTLHDLLRGIRRSYEDSISKENVIRAPRISMALVVEIRLRLDQGRAITTDACMINSESQKTNIIEGAGDTK